MISAPDVDSPLPVDESGLYLAHGHTPPCGACAAVQRDPATELPVVDMARALEDFDNDAAAVNGLLHDFLGDKPACLRQLAALQGATGSQARALVHDLANTLDAGWCRMAALVLRSQEDRLRADATAALADIAAEVEATVHKAFDGVRRQLAHCLPCPLGARA